jgi:uncharacterized protein YqhQ
MKNSGKHTKVDDPKSKKKNVVSKKSQTGFYRHDESASIRNYRVLSITSIFFSILIGLVALNYSWQADKAAEDGDLDRAKKFSGRARTWAIVGIVVGFIFIIVRIVLGSKKPGRT